MQHKHLDLENVTGKIIVSSSILVAKINIQCNNFLCNFIACHSPNINTLFLSNLDLLAKYINGRLKRSG